MAEKMAKEVKISKITPAGEGHQVVSMEGGGGGYRKKPCSDCPWRKDAVGVFPAEAFAHSATTAYDMAQNKFGCHQSGVNKPATCAGFLLSLGQSWLAQVKMCFNQGQTLTLVRRWLRKQSMLWVVVKKESDCQTVIGSSDALAPSSSQVQITTLA